MRYLSDPETGGEETKVRLRWLRRRLFLDTSKGKESKQIMNPNINPLVYQILFLSITSSDERFLQQVRAKINSRRLRFHAYDLLQD